MPRPNSKNRRDQQLNFSLTRDELTALRRRADAAGMHLVDFGRDLLLRRRAPSTRGYDTEMVEAEGTLARAARLLTGELRRLGNNLNQIARRLNTREEPAPPSLEPLLREIRILLNRGSRP